MDQECDVCSAPVPGGGLCIVCGYTNFEADDPDGGSSDPDECGFCEGEEDGERCDVCGHLVECDECDD